MCGKMPIEILTVLSNVFIINVLTRQTTLMKLCTQIEKSFWFFLDNTCSVNNVSTTISFEEYAKEIFNLPSLSILLQQLQNDKPSARILQEYKEYKSNLPTYGAILLSADLMYVLLVQTYHAKGLWGFPKGKVDDENEDPSDCAIREVLEETSYNIAPCINHNWYVEGEWRNSTSTGYTGLYVIPNVSMSTEFKARTEKEIKYIRWFRLCDLFAAKNGLNANTEIKITANAFYMKNCLKIFLNQRQFVDEYYYYILNRRRQQHNELRHVNFNGRPNSHCEYRKTNQFKF